MAKFAARVFDKSEIPEGYIIGLGRDYPYPFISHLYQGSYAKPEGPMCHYGANRDNGDGFSIWRGNVGKRGVCKICMKRARAGLDHIWKTEDTINATDSTENSEDISVSMYY